MRDTGQATGMSDYVTANNLAYANNNRIPVVKVQENKHLLYRPGANAFNSGETNVIHAMEDRDKLIKELDTGMSPFMKNQNDHMQRMKRSVARQEAIAAKYTKGELQNFSISDQKKD